MSEWRHFEKDFGIQVSLKRKSVFQNLVNLYYLINMGKNKSYEVSTRKIIVQMHKDGSSYREIITALKVSKTIVIQTVQFRQLKRCLVNKKAELWQFVKIIRWVSRWWFSASGKKFAQISKGNSDSDSLVKMEQNHP